MLCDATDQGGQARDAALARGQEAAVEKALAVTAEDGEEERGRSLRKAAILTSLLAIAHAALFLLGIFLIRDIPGGSATDQEIHDYYSKAESRRVVLAGLYVMPFAGVAFIWFIVALRMWCSGLIRRENVLLSNVQLVSGIVYIALIFAGSGAMSVLAASIEFADGPVDPVIARQFPQYGSELLFVFAMRMAAMFVFTTSNIGRTAGIMPRWFVFLGFAVGAFLLLSATFSLALILVFPAWLTILGILLLHRARSISPDIRIREATTLVTAPAIIVREEPPAPPTSQA
jgi:hypothetical protein